MPNITVDQYESMLVRFERQEAVINNILNAITKLASIDQLRQLVNLRQTEITNLQSQVIALENAVEAIQAVLNL